MPRQTISAHSIARSLQEALTARPFSGRMLGVFHRACNFIDQTGWIIALVLPKVGNGPFAIVIEGEPGMFQSLAYDQPVQANQQELTVGPWTIPLSKAKIWEPKINPLPHPLDLDRMIDITKPYAEWPNFTEDTPIARNMAHVARQAETSFSQLVTQTTSDDSLKTAVARLAGLGSGLTPAGDDYLLGAMAALWLTGRPDNLPKIAEFAGPKTNTLSRSFLEAAARGEFAEPWHRLTLAWHNEDNQAIIEAIERIARFGASSGYDALAGFAKTLSSLPHRPMPSHR